MQDRGGWLLSGAVLVALGVVVALPLVFIVLQGVFPHLPDGAFHEPLLPLIQAFTDERLPEQFLNTVGLGLAVAATSLAIALPLALLRGLARLPFAQMWDILFLIPFMMPPYIGALAWALSLQPGGYLQQLTGVHLSELLFSRAGIVLVMALHLFPVIYFALSRTVATVGQRYAQAARVSGATAWQALWRITLPLSMPGLAASLLLVFALSIEEYGTPATLGKPIQFMVIVTSIEEKLAEWPIDLPGAAVLSVLLATLALGAFFLQNWIVTRRSRISLGGKHGQHEPTELGRWRWLVLAGFVLVALLAVGAPVAAVTATAFSQTLSGGLAWDNFGLRHFRAIFANESGALDALWTSLWLATGAALATGLLGALVAWVTVRSQLPGRRWVDGLAALPNALPGMVVAVGLILAWNRSWWPIPIYNTAVVLMLAYVCLLLPYPVRYVGASLRQISGSLDDAARVAGAGLGLTLRRIVLPLVAPQLMIAMLLVFAIASRELVASIMLAPSGMKTVATFVFNQFSQGAPGLGMALAILAIFSSTALLVVISVVYGRNNGNATAAA